MKALVTALLIAFTATPLNAATNLLATANIPSDSTDLSGLGGNLEDGTPANKAGAFGSGIAYSGIGWRFLALPDRGPNASTYNASVDNTTSFRARFHDIELNVTSTAAGAYAMSPNLIKTTLLSAGASTPPNGLASSFNATNQTASTRLDPEEIRLSANAQTVYISDEYGPFLDEYAKDSGQRIRRFALPAKFSIASPASTSAAEIAGNTAGRVANRGMEGLAISPDGRFLFGVMQNPLIQDGGREGLNVRILKINTQTSESQEYVYVLDNKSNGLNAAVAVNEQELLILERDGRAGTSAQTKKIFKVSLSGASDVSAQSALPLTAVVAPVQATVKTLFLDLLDPRFGLSGAAFPEKIEGLAFGPKLADGRLSLLVSSDNDFLVDQANRFFLFAIDAADLNFVAQGFAPPPTRAPALGNLAILLLCIGILMGLALFEAPIAPKS
jgi:Esterase-like activity of phytase